MNGFRKKAGVTRTLLESIKTKKLRYFGHIMRHNCIEKDITQGTLSGKKKGEDQRQHG